MSGAAWYILGLATMALIVWYNAGMKVSDHVVIILLVLFLGAVGMGLFDLR